VEAMSGGKLKSAARTLSDRLGCSYQAGLMMLRTYKERHPEKRLDEALADILDTSAVHTARANLRKLEEEIGDR